MKQTAVFFLFALLFAKALNAQHLKPGFDKQEYIDLMKISAEMGDSAYFAKIPVPAGFKRLYRSPEMGLVNLWDLWITNTGMPVISIRGTTAKQISWAANFYAAMVPAKGELQLTKDIKFAYRLASNPRAAVHTGWLVGMAFLANDMRPKIDSLYKAGNKNILIMGHSQGGAIAFLLTAYLYNLQKQNLLPGDIRFKTYCSAGPKPGNLYFAYEYEAMTQQGWAYNVVNSADWVPETSVSIQTANDFNEINPFVNAQSTIKKQSFINRIAFKHAYKKLTKNNQKAADNYRKYLGRYVAKSIKKQLPGFVEPAYAATSDYVRTGNTITLLADDDYYRQFPQDKSQVFVNHLHAPYLYLTNKLNMNPMEKSSTGSAISGSWELVLLAGENMDMHILYPGKKPILVIDESAKQANGNTGCNSFKSSVTVEGNQISFPQNMAMTRMMCPGNGESSFLSALKTITGYRVENNELSLMDGDKLVMRLVRK